MKFWEITKKDLKLLVRDVRALVVLILFPLLFITILGVTTGQLVGWQDENQRLQIAIVDEVDYVNVAEPREYAEDPPKIEPVPDNGEEAGSEELTDDMDAGPIDEQELARMRKNAKQLIEQFVLRMSRQDGLHIETIDRKKAEKWLADGERPVILFLGPETFKKIDQLRLRDLFDSSTGKLKEGLASLDISMKSRQSYSNTMSVVESIALDKIVRTIFPYVACKNAGARRMMNQNEGGSACEQFTLEGKPAPLPEKPPVPTVKSKSIYQELVPQYTVMFVFFLVPIMARSILHERDLGTLRRLRIAPLRPAALLAGKTIPFYLLSVGQTLLLFLCGKLLFKMDWGPHPEMLLPVILATSLAATSLGLLIATLVKTESQVSAYGNTIVILMAGISGCFMPRDWLPTVMQKVSLGTPHAWSLIAYQQLLTFDNPNVMIVLQSCGVLTAFALFFFILGCLRFGNVD